MIYDPAPCSHKQSDVRMLRVRGLGLGYINKDKINIYSGI